ncbi:LOW QUALITY PROTEIN: mucin-5B-like [Tautogolabrus adspersus]
MRWSCMWLCFFAFSVSSVSEVQARQVRNHVSSICSTWGREHFKTFDGDVFQFPGMCEYNLASDCHSPYQEFSVHMKRKDNDGNPTVGYVTVTINDLSFHLSKSLVTVNGLPVHLPYYSGGVQVEKNAVYIKLQSKVGIVVMWNGDDSVMVELDAEYANRTCGLCGDFNGISVYNEFIHNDRKISAIEFGNNQKVHRPNDDCEDPYEEEDEEAVTVHDSCKEFQSSCEEMLRLESWSSCTNQIQPEPYIKACVQDMCGCNNRSNDFCVCSTLSEFSRQCSHAGGQPPNWRTPQFCAKHCPYNMVYEESGSPCMDTCTHQDTSSLCEDHKMDGCFCPTGTVFDNISLRGCIAQTECQCKHDRIYDSGEVYRQDREECTCFEGRWACKSLQTPSTCAVEEGSHVTTFDGKTFTFHGECYYTLAKVESKGDASPKFTILAQLVPCANQKFDTCLKTLKVLLNNDRNNVLMFSSDGTVKQNMQTISLPFNSGDINIFHASSFHILLQTSFGLQIQIQHVPLMQVYVTLEQSYRAKTRGLCGNYNMVLSDDMKTPQGIVEGTAATFINSWKANLMCRDREERLDDPCSLSVENENYAKHWCALLLSPSSTFAQCHSVVDADIYYERCTYASCNCEKSEDCLCAVFSSYARACASKGVFLTDWRENVCDKYSRSCPVSQTFSYKHQRCQLTCRSLGSMQQSCTSDFLPVDGCSCSEGLYLNDDGICVTMEKCPCYHNQGYIKPGKSISIKDEHCVCTNGVLHCRSWRSRSLACPFPKVFLNCSAAGTGELGLQCARTCLNLDSDDCDSTECESGCQCPVGLLDDGKGSCVKENQCPCQHSGRFYVPGSTIPNQCNTCTCKSGNWECTNKKCPGTCIIYGSGHYNTFDQRTYGFQGHCAYVAVKNNCGNKTVQDNFGVITENVPCGSTGTTCSKTVRIQLGRMEVKLSKGKYEVEDLGHGAQIQYKIRTVGLYLVVESAIGLTVIWDRKTTVRTLLDPKHSGEVCGLCGDFNGDGQNDFTTQGQLTVSNVLEFANSWKVSSSCPDVDASVDACGARPNRHHWAKMMCSIITGDTFKNCHNRVAPRPFYESCVKDSCACDSGGDCECFCTAVAAYAQACNEADVCVAWRTPEICPVFCDYYNSPDDCKWHYNPCHTPCYKTCLNPQGQCSIPTPNLEGCYPVCPEDKPLFDEETQMCVEDCEGCFYNGTRYEDDAVIYNVTDNLGMCYYAICINSTVIFENETCVSTTTPTTTTPTTIATTTPLTKTTLTPPTTEAEATTPPTTEEPTTPREPPNTTTTAEPTTTTKATTPPTTPPTTEEPTTPREPPNTTTTAEPTTTTKATTPPTTPPTTEEPTTPREPPNTTTTAEPTTTTKATTPPTTPPTTEEPTTPREPPNTTTTAEPTTTTKATTPPTTPTTTEEPTTPTKPPNTTTTAEPTTTTKATTPPTTPTTTEEPTTPEEPTTTTSPPVITTESTTTTAEPTTTTTEPTTTTKTTTEPTTTTKATTPPTTTPTSTKEPTTPTKPITTTSPPFITTESTTTTAEPTTTTTEPTTTTRATTPPTTTPTSTKEPTTPTKPTTTTSPPEPTTPTKPITTTSPPAITTESTTTTAEPTTTTTEPTTTTKATTPPTTTPTSTKEPTTPTKPTTTTSPPPTTTTRATTPPTTTPTSTKEPTTPTKPTTTTSPPVITTESTTTTAEPTTTTSEPTTTTKVTTQPTTPCITTCEWSEWYDVHNPQEDKSDWETYENIINSGKEICESPKEIDCRATNYPDKDFNDFISQTGQVVTCDLSIGLTCRQQDQLRPPRKCFNYKIRVCCEVEICGTTTSSALSTTVSTTTKQTEPTTRTDEPTTPTKPTTTTSPPVITTESTTTTAEPTTTTTEPTTTTRATTPPTTTPTSTKEPTTSTKPITTTSPPEPTTPTKPTTTTSPPVITTESTTTTAEPTTTTTEPTTTTRATTPPTTPTSTKESTTSTKPTTTTSPPISEHTATTTKATTQTTEPSTTSEEPTPTFTHLATTTQHTTTVCFCIVNGKHYMPGDVIFNMEHIGSGVCLTMICSDICEIQNKTEICTTTSTPTTTPSVGPTCPEWDVVQNETFVLCNCTMARCIENNTIEIIPYECPPIEPITCTNGKKPTLVYDKYHCCQHYACDCVCEGWGDPHYITFDGLFYSYQGNCTYVLMEEILPIHNLKIYIENVFCDPTEDVSCPRSIIVSYGTQVITLLNHNLIGAAQLEALKDRVLLKLPYSQQGVKILNSGINLILEIPRLDVVITFGITGFSVTLPFQYFGRNTQGHCGTCNNNQADDCMLPGGQLIESCAVMADYWPATHIYQPNCHIPPVLPTNTPEPPPTLTPCKPDSMCGLITSSLFAECHRFVSPDNFYQGCVFDSCHVSNPAVECTSLQTYAAACAQAGVCLHWRNHTTLCASDCPSDKIYKPCGSAEQPTCEDNPNEPTMNYTTEGCFCPDGMKLFNKESGICVDKCGCLDPEGIPREFNEMFEYKCQNCICEESTKTVICKPKVCPVPPITHCTLPGFVLANQTNPSDHCCSTFFCECRPNTCPAISSNCPIGYMPIINVPEGKCCQEHTCEPKRVCVHREAEYQPGDSVPAPLCQECICTNEIDPKSGLFKVSCKFLQCQENCDMGYEYVESDSDECCGKCVQTHCVLNVNGSKQLLMQGQTWSPPENKCEHYTCVKNDETFATISSHTVCPPFQQSNCQPDSIQTAANGCCKICVEREKACKKGSLKTYIMHKGCQSYQEVDMPYCEGSCNTFSKYSEAAAVMQYSCSCCKETRYSNRTVDLHCLNGDTVSHTYMHVEECGCGHTECTGDAGHHARRRRSFKLV